MGKPSKRRVTAGEGRIRIQTVSLQLHLENEATGQSKQKADEDSQLGKPLAVWSSDLGFTGGRVEPFWRLMLCSFSSMYFASWKSGKQLCSGLDHQKWHL